MSPSSLLHAAVSRPDADAATVASLLCLHPELASSVDEQGRCPLAAACAAGAPAAVVSILLDAHPAGVRAVEPVSGRCALHHAASRPAPLSVVSLLLAALPSSARARDAAGRTPLHCAAGAGASVAVLDALLESHPPGCSDADASGATPLHHAATFPRHTPGLGFLIRSSAVGACGAADANGATPLHAALLSARPVAPDAVAQLVAAWPEALSVRDGRGRMPLHCAVQRPATVPPAVAAALLAACPSVAGVADEAGHLPLHCAASQRFSHCETLSRLCSAYPPAAFHHAGARRRTPLHCAAACGAGGEAIRVLIAACPAARHALDARGRTPLHLAADAAEPSTDCSGEGGCGQATACAATAAALALACPEVLPLPHAPGRPLRAWLLRSPAAEVDAFVRLAMGDAQLARVAIHDVSRVDALAAAAGALAAADPTICYAVEPAPPPQLAKAVAAARGRTLRDGSAADAAPAAAAAVPHSRVACDALSSASPACRAAMLREGLFLRRYELLRAPPPPQPEPSPVPPGAPPPPPPAAGGSPIVCYSGRRSGTRVLLALDTLAPASTPSHTAPQLVALKCVTSLAKLRREASARAGLSLEYVLPVLRTHVWDHPPPPSAGTLPLAHFSGAAPSVAALLAAEHAEQCFALCVPRHVLVLPACDGTLAAALASRSAVSRASCAERDWPSARRIFADTAAALSHLHSRGRIHGDIRPSNLVRCAPARSGERAWRLIDLDGCVDIAHGHAHAPPPPHAPPRGTYLPDRAAAAWSPPEAVYLPRPNDDGACARPCLKRVPERGVIDAWPPGALRAHPSFDVWALGAVLFEVVSGAPLLSEHMSEHAEQPGDAADAREEGALGADGLRALDAWDRVALEASMRPIGATRPPASLSPADAATFVASRDAAVDLLRWLLAPNPCDRPPMALSLRHAFVVPNGPDAATLQRGMAAASSGGSGGGGGTVGQSQPPSSGGFSSLLLSLFSPAQPAAAVVAQSPTAAAQQAHALWRGLAAALALDRAPPVASGGGSDDDDEASGDSGAGFTPGREPGNDLRAH